MNLPRIKLTAPVAVLAILASITPAVAGESALGLTRKGNDYYRQDRLNEAIQSFRDAIARDPSSPLIRYNLGTTLARDQRYDEAEKILGQAADHRDPYRPDSLFNLGVARVEKALKDQSAVKQYLDAVAADPATGRNQPEVNPEALGKAIDQLRQGLAAFRQAILASSQPLDAKYNFEVTQKMIEQLKKLQQQQQQEQQQQKDDPQKQQPDKPQQKQQDQKQDQKPDSQKQNQQDQPQPQPQPSESQPDKQQPEPISPQQMDALSLLNLLEQQKPEQFKKLFAPPGRPRPMNPEKDW